jgi:hypothetical protein
MRVALTYRKCGYDRFFEPELERLDELDEVWAMCFRKPAPGWRLFGRFIEKDTFLGLRAFDRHVLANRNSYRTAAADIELTIWREFCGDTPPHRGGEISDYITGPFIDANADY